MKKPITITISIIIWCIIWFLIARQFDHPHIPFSFVMKPITGIVFLFDAYEYPDFSDIILPFIIFWGILILIIISVLHIFKKKK